MASHRLLILVFVLLLAGCAGRTHPDMPHNVVEARRQWEQMQRQPVELERPVVILTGYRDPGFVPHRLVPVMRRLTGDDRVIGLAYPCARDFDQCRQRTIDFVDRNFPSDDPVWTTEVDVIAISMGGLIARYSACAIPDRPDARRLRIARLYTISTPHSGARLAALPSFNRLQRDMRPGSDFLMRLDQLDADRPYPVIAYARRGDLTVGTANTALAGQRPLWVRNRFMQLPHAGAADDPRIIADIARRLRGQVGPTLSKPLPGTPGE